MNYQFLALGVYLALLVAWLLVETGKGRSR